MCDIIIMSNELALGFCSCNSKAAGFRVCRFSFCTDCGIIFTDNSPNELLVWSGLKISASTSAQLTKFSLPPAYSQCVPCGRRFYMVMLMCNTKEERVSRIAKYYTTFHLFGDWYIVRFWPRHCHSWTRFIPFYIPMHLGDPD